MFRRVVIFLVGKHLKVTQGTHTHLKTISKWLLGLALLSGSIIANADAVTYDLTGIVTGATGIYSSAGSTVTGTFTINVGVGVGTSPTPSFSSPWSSNSGGAYPPVVVSTLESGSVTFSDAGSYFSVNGVGGFAPSGSNAPNEYFAVDEEYSGLMPFVDNNFHLFGGTGVNAPFDAKGLPVFANATGGGYGTLYDYWAGGFSKGQLNYTLTSLTPVPLPAAGAPEIDPTSAASGLTLLIAGLIVLRGRKQPLIEA